LKGKLINSRIAQGRKKKHRKG